MKNDRYSGKIKLEFFGKVQEYFKRRYPGHRKYDETGKPIRD